MTEVENVLDSLEKLNTYFNNTNSKSVILFADLSGSTEYKQNRHFVNGLYKTKIHNDKITEIVIKHGGRVVKYIGDATMCEFKCVNELNVIHNAINAAIKIIEAFEEFNKNINDNLEKIYSKIGIAYGAVAYFYNDDPQGKHVDLAARIEAIAKPNQILIHKSVHDACDISKVWSAVGRVLQYSPNDYFSTSVSRNFKGIHTPQEIMEVKTMQHFLGIESAEYLESWENYRFEAELFPISGDLANIDFIKDNYLKIIYDLQYDTVLTRDKLRFVCTNETEQFDKAFNDNELFSRYNLPTNDVITENMSKIFDVNFVQVGSEYLTKTYDTSYNKYGCYNAQDFTSETLKAQIGKKVHIRYKVTTVVNKYAHFYYMMTEYPTKGLNMIFKFANTEIDKAWYVDWFSSNSNMKHRTKPTVNGTNGVIEIELRDEWISPRSGVIFIWRLKSEGKKRSKRHKMLK